MRKKSRAVNLVLTIFVRTDVDEHVDGHAVGPTVTFTTALSTLGTIVIVRADVGAHVDAHI